MSTPLVLDTNQLKRLAEALDELSRTTRRTEVRLDAYGTLDIAIDGNTLHVTWDEDRGYIVSDRTGD